MSGTIDWEEFIGLLMLVRRDVKADEAVNDTSYFHLHWVRRVVKVDEAVNDTSYFHFYLFFTNCLRFLKQDAVPDKRTKDTLIRYIDPEHRGYVLTFFPGPTKFQCVVWIKCIFFWRQPKEKCDIEVDRFAGPCQKKIYFTFSVPCLPLQQVPLINEPIHHHVLFVGVIVGVIVSPFPKLCNVS